ncbi:PREDICTED: uncharacterized protein LOC106146599 [Chinchilla lanigera]|uniref:uncharacterized protein LOC106146599 n=1 Tax=Chinchilla lanigera TaxID=34839 RepID=UPI000698E086|nr:PREDICTED: uncharacterized protein LOC106146599 [Chinchilla lanigera]
MKGQKEADPIGVFVFHFSTCCIPGAGLWRSGGNAVENTPDQGNVLITIWKRRTMCFSSCRFSSSPRDRRISSSWPKDSMTDSLGHSNDISLVQDRDNGRRRPAVQLALQVGDPGSASADLGGNEFLMAQSLVWDLQAAGTHSKILFAFRSLSSPVCDERKIRVPDNERAGPTNPSRSFLHMSHRLRILSLLPCLHLLQIKCLP